MTASPGSERGKIEEVCNNLSIEKIEYRNEDDSDVKQHINPIDTTWKWFTIPQEYKYRQEILDDKLKENVAVITGANSSIWSTTALRLLWEGKLENKGR